MNKKKWFSLAPSVFIWRKKEQCLFYDSDTFRSKLLCVENSAIDGFISELQNIDNLYCIDITEKSDEKIISLLKEIIHLKMGRVVGEDEMHGKRPVQLPPLLNVQSDVERLQIEGITHLTIGENVLEYIHEVRIILSENIEPQTIQSILFFIESLRKSNLYSIKISGYTPDFNPLTVFWQSLHSMPALKTIELDFNDDILIDVLLGIKELAIENYKLQIQIGSDFNENYFDKVDNFLQSERITHAYEFAISSEDEFEKIRKKIKDFNPESMRIKPIFTGHNHTFFENSVYVDENDILNAEMTKKNIFAHQALNTNDFGKLTITSDGMVYANPRFPHLGTAEDDIRLLVYREISVGASWRRIRDMAPCSDCIYQWLCSSPSDYELELNKPNLCHVKQ